MPNPPPPGQGRSEAGDIQTFADHIRDQARSARLQAETLLAEGNLPGARLWFERAHRLLPDDPALTTALAGVLLRLADADAGRLFAEALRAADTREIRLGLVAAAWQQGDHSQARDALGALLAGHVLDRAAVAEIADVIAPAEGGAGWCGVCGAEDGHRWLSNVVAAEAVVDGEPLQGPDLPADGRLLQITGRGRPLLGSPIYLARLRHVEGFVAAHDAGLIGWAWHPADVDRDPRLVVSDGAGRFVQRLVAGDHDQPGVRPMTRPRGCSVPAEALAGHVGPFCVLGADRPLSGSPVDPFDALRAAQAAARMVARAWPALSVAEARGETPSFSAQAAVMGPRAAAVPAPDRPVAIVIPVYRDLASTLACLDSVRANCPEAPVIVIDDATPEPALAVALDRLHAEGAITLLRNAVNQGFPASANAGLRAAFTRVPPHDALLLNSDTLVPEARGPSFLDRLRAAVHATPDIGTAAPLSNDATILSYPSRDGTNPRPNRAGLRRLDAQAARANADEVIDLPTSVGFCMYVRRECAVETGLFRADLFAQGYGEENDFCIRARHLGWRHVAVPGVFVAHLGGASFGRARSPLIARNLAVLERLHPGYHALIADYQTSVPEFDPLAPARRRLDALRWADGRKPTATLLITHDSGGGVERVIRRRAAEIAADGNRAVVLRPVPDPGVADGFLPGLCRVSDGADPTSTPNLVFDLPRELGPLARLLRADRPERIEVHHRLGHATAVMGLARRLAVPVEHHLHDYAAFCPRITLIGPDRRYCGEPTDIAICEACVADAGDRMQPAGEPATRVADLIRRSTREFAEAQRVVVPSADMAGRLRRHFPGLRAEAVPLEPDHLQPRPQQPSDRWPRRICVIGAISVEKGFDVLLACARDVAARDLPLEFLLVGHSTDDRRLMDTGRVFITGRYAEADAVSLIKAQMADLAFLPSIWPETWGFTLGLAWRAGLRAVVFDIGAMAARVRTTGHGAVLPLGLSVAGINNALMAPG